MESPYSFNPGDGWSSRGKRLLVMHASCPPTEFTDLEVARKFIARISAHGLSHPDVYQFDPRAGGWCKVESAFQ